MKIIEFIGGFFLLIIALKLISYTSSVKCRSCGWTGSNSKWAENKCCPNCHSDSMQYNGN